MTVSIAGYQCGKFDSSEMAYMTEKTNVDSGQGIALIINGSPESPLINPAIKHLIRI
jgi:hypothetical protein